MNVLVCPNCKVAMTSCFKSAICLVCGNIAVEPPLSTAFEDAVEGEVVEAPKKEPKKSDTSQRTASDGGRVF